ncbi:hypothetical protein C1645_824919 [Glomus cerebriforme]|uniref:MULE transposase domain-containing protein n=1 Tax=Glomus cerebriforme TaxID=658196 RepID=A0A397STA6_9GLOM|nr:hypothetical protein C1645_824919 [Glomus cerebriforme]
MLMVILWLIEDQHHLQSIANHNHAAEASHVNVVKKLQSLESLIIPENMQKTLDSSDFLIKDSTIGHDRILLFTTVTNINHLDHSFFWIMDGTFKTVPTLFKQLYTIHGCDLINFSDEQEIYLQPQFILTDFEQAAINAIHAKFQDTSGLTVRYETDETFSLLIHHIPALAFLPPDEIPIVFDELKTNMPVEANEIIEWFEHYYIRDRVRYTSRSGNVVQSAPIFPPSLWSVTDNIEYAFLQTQNSVEAWHRRWEILVGGAYVGVFKIIIEIQKEQNQVQLEAESILRGLSRNLTKRKNCEHESRIQILYNDQEIGQLWIFLGILPTIFHFKYYYNNCS